MEPIKRWNALLRMAMTRVLVFRKFSISLYWLYISILLKIIIIGIFGYASWQTISSVNVSPLFFPIMFAATLGPIIYFNLKKSKK
jgi:hypothetical protein